MKHVNDAFIYTFDITSFIHLYKEIQKDSQKDSFFFSHVDTHVNDACYTYEQVVLVGSIKLQVSFAKETYKRDYILQKRPIILSMMHATHMNKSRHTHTYGVASVSRID